MGWVTGAGTLTVFVRRPHLGLRMAGAAAMMPI